MANWYVDKYMAMLNENNLSYENNYATWKTDAGNSVVCVMTDSTHRIALSPQGDLVQRGNPMGNPLASNVVGKDVIVFTVKRKSQIHVIENLIDDSVYDGCNSVRISGKIPDDLKPSEDSQCNRRGNNSFDGETRRKIGQLGEQYAINELRKVLPSGTELWAGGRSAINRYGDIDIVVHIPSAGAVIVDIKARGRSHGEVFTMSESFDDKTWERTGWTMRSKKSKVPMSVFQRDLLDMADEQARGNLPVILVPVSFDMEGDNYPFNNPAPARVEGKSEGWYKTRQFILSELRDVPQAIRDNGENGIVLPDSWDGFTFDFYEKVK